MGRKKVGCFAKMVLCAVLVVAFLCADVETVSAAGLPKKMDMSFSSGAGGWGTEITLRKNGKFKGDYHDSDMGSTGEGYPNGTVYYCVFSGQFGQIKKVDDHKYQMKLKSIRQNAEPGSAEIADNIQYISSEPYGVEKGKTYILYCPGYRISKLPKQAREWLYMPMWIDRSDTVLDGYVLYNKKMGYAFYGK